MKNKIVSIDEIHYDNDVYNLHVEDNHNYFADDLLVSNCHQAHSPVLIKIINNLNQAPFKFGFTGTLSGSKVHELQVKSWFGSIIKSSSTKELMDRGLISKLKVKCFSIDHSANDRSEAKGLDYQREIEYIISHSGRNKFIVDLALQQNNNTLVLFNYLKHGDALLDLLKLATDKQVFMVRGDVSADERERIRGIMEESDNVILLATFGTLSVGVNIKNLHCAILAHPFKARIRILQSIGRTLRKLDEKTSTIIDLIDDLSYKNHQNFAFKHGIDRMKIYEKENFKYTFESVIL